MPSMDVVVAELAERAVEVDRRVVAAVAQEADQALGLAEGIGADEVGAVGEAGERGAEAGDLAGRVGVVEHRQAEGGLGDEEIAGDRLEACTGRVGGALVVAGDDGAAAGGLDGDLGRAEDVAGGVEADAGGAEVDGRAEGGFLGGAGEIGAVADRHDLEGLAGGEDGAVAGAGVVGMGMGDQGSGDRADRVDMGLRRFAPEAFRAGGEDVLETHGGVSDAGDAGVKSRNVLARTENKLLFSLV